MGKRGRPRSRDGWSRPHRPALSAQLAASKSGPNRSRGQQRGLTDAGARGRSPLTIPLPGQFVVLRLRPEADAPPVLRSYSLSDLPDAGRYRISIKEEPQGIASTYLSTQLR